MGRLKIFHASVNPEYYDVKQLSAMSFDEAVSFFDKDEIDACTVGMTFVNSLEEAQEFVIHADGVSNGDGSDTMLNWYKVEV